MNYTEIVALKSVNNFPENRIKDRMEKRVWTRVFHWKSEEWVLAMRNC